ncbi:N-acetylglucosaminyl-diphospho-decaprenol L-rhamnosyltransferase [Microbacterium oleivorans]|uniref:glycosyltransferase family 2 protein n=1 Tax=Microbacterium oleivorans TaxID=273677 RepID=UPI000977026A|nr:glycosyltransferase [Microbacterium oleivorans]AZS44860.1 N-acetylglucosaminyl-diphospho-decaprenol L-rhamnosyltransferase [Microbacterium oleivorans]
MSAVDVTVAVVTFRTDHDLLDRCLTSARAASEASGLRIELVIIDNSVSDELHAFKDKADRWIDMGENAGFARASNRALESSLGEFTLLLNPDAALEPTALRTLFDAGQAQPEALFCGWLRAHGKTQVDAFMLWWTSLGRVLRRNAYRRYLDETSATSALVEVQKVSGGALFGLTTLLRSLGPFDDRYFLYGEDVDLSVRARKAGIRRYAARDALVLHQASSSQAQHSQLVEAARADAAIRLNSYHLPRLVSFATRLEYAVMSAVGLLPGLGRTSGSATVRLARLAQIRRWGLKADLPRFDPQSSTASRR